MDRERFIELPGVADLDHDLLRRFALADSLYSGPDRSCTIHVVVFDQEHVEETGAMVLRTTAFHSVLVESVQTWCALASVVDPGRCSPNGVNESAFRRGD